MEKEPVLSFVVPVYQKPPEVFEKCLASLYDGSLKDIEVICVFDGPNPELKVIAENYKKTLIFEIEHGGAPKARNYGLDMAKGKYVCFWDADCVIKPDTAARWIQEFDATGADFVYTGYEFSGERGGYGSEQYDRHSLECGNFISTMSPILRSKAPRWDEALKGAQDWDYWLTATENGCVPAYIEGSGFVTEMPDRTSISAGAWSPERRDETIRVVKEKHNIPIRDVAVTSFRHFVKGLHLAKMLNADIVKSSGFPLSKYKVIFNLGYGEYIRFPGAKSDAVKIHYWLPWDIDCIYAIAYKTARESLKLAKADVTYHFTEDIASKKRLEDLGIEAEIMPLPTDIKDSDLETVLPEKFRVLVDADKAYKPVFLDIPKALPNFEVDFIDEMHNQAPISKYSVLLSFRESPCVDEGIKRFLLNGRYVISNVQSPFCGYVDMAVSHGSFKNEIINKLFDLKAEPFNKKAQGYYKSLVTPERFVEKIRLLYPKIKMEVANV